MTKTETRTTDTPETPEEVTRNDPDRRGEGYHREDFHRDLAKVTRRTKQRAAAAT